MVKSALIFSTVCLLAIFAFSDTESLVPRKQSFDKSQMVRDPGYYSPQNVGFSSLLDPSRFNMRHMYMMQYSTGTYGSDMLGAYINSMSYDFKIPMRLTLDLGYFHRPMDLMKDDRKWSSQSSSSFLVPRVKLDYQASKNVFMSIQYMHLPTGYNPYSPYYSPRRRFSPLYLD